MQRTKISLIVLVILIFLIGIGVIVYFGRPVMQLAQNEETAEGQGTVLDETENGETNETPEETSAPVEPAPDTNKDNTYTMAEVASHATATDCWTTINGGVYDLTTWVGRHPGGASAIVALCGTDGSAKFNAKHGGGSAQLAALALLKIGALE